MVADAEATGTLQDTGTALYQFGQGTVLADHLKHFSAARSYSELHVGSDGVAIQHLGDLDQVGVAGVGTGADEHLVDRHAGELSDVLDIAGTMGTGRFRLDLGKIDFEESVIDGIDRIVVIAENVHHGLGHGRLILRV